MELQTIFEQVRIQADNVEPIGARIKFLLDDEAIMIDGTGESNEVTLSDEEADTVIIASKKNFAKLKDGSLNPMMAVMMGKVKIKGDMGLAMKLQSLL